VPKSIAVYVLIILEGRATLQFPSKQWTLEWKLYEWWVLQSIIYLLIKLFKKGQNLICVYCINQPKNTGALTSDRGYGGIYGYLFSRKKQNRGTQKANILCLVYHRVFSHISTTPNYFMLDLYFRRLPKMSEDYQRFPKRGFSFIFVVIFTWEIFCSLQTFNFFRERNHCNSL